MTCPPDLAAILLEIVAQGILWARAAGWAGDANRCAAEADHIHNLPSLLANYSPDLLQFYWTVERPAFMATCSAQELRSWEPLWERLRSHMENLREPAPA